MNNNDLQTLIDLPSGRKVQIEGQYEDELVAADFTTDKLTSLATELRDRRTFDAWSVDAAQSLRSTYHFIVHDEDARWLLLNNGVEIASGASPFKAWQNAKEEGRL